MWDKPHVLNPLASALYGIAVLIAFYGLVMFAVHQPAFLLREVRIAGALRHVSAVELESAVRAHLHGTFFTFDIAALRAAFERVAWVRKAQVRRHWPDRLEVTLEEHVPYARWGEAELVNTQGEVFRADYANPLPVFVGPAGSATEIAIQYEHFRRTLAAAGRTPVFVQVSPRRAWQIRLDDGLVVELGRTDVESRLARFVAAYDRTVARVGRRIEYVDLRYANGFAARVPGLRQDPAETKPRGRRAGGKART